MVQVLLGSSLLGTPPAERSAGGATLVEQPITSSVAPVYLDGSDWSLQQLLNGSDNGGLINATVPGDILTDLQRAGRIPDPYWNTSWREPSFIAAWNEGSWRYSKSFTSPVRSAHHAEEVLLCFDGVLMGATFELNGVSLTTTINPLLGNVTGATDQFLRYVFPVGRLLRPGVASNRLSATFGGDYPGTSNGRFTFSTSIDWAPEMLTADRQGRATFGFGLWKSIYLLPLPHGLALTHMVPLTFYTGGHPTSRLSDTDHAGFVVNVTIDFFSTTVVPTASVTVMGSWDGAKPVSRICALKAGINAVQLSIPAAQTEQVRLWHPNGHGEQPLYNISATVSVSATAPGGDISATRRIGFRHTALVTFNDTNATEVAAAVTMQNTDDFTMMFRVNGAAVYARGGSMIPMDLLNGRLSDHDLQFTGKAGSVTFSNVVEAEIQHNIKRLSHHASIFLWDACNECKLFYPWWKPVLPAVAAVDTSRPIWPSSPGNGWVSGVERITCRPIPGARQNANPHWRGPGVDGFPWPMESHGPYTGFMHEPYPGVNNWTMPHAQPAAAQVGGMGGANNPSAVPAWTGPGQEGWAKSEFGANSWPSFESISSQLPKDQWSMASPGAKQRNWNVSNIIEGFFGLPAAMAMHETGEVAFKRQLYQSLIAQTLYLKTMIQSWRSTNIMISIWWMYNELWPTGGWGSIEYGSNVSGQILGGRWKPLHYEMRASTFADHMATCNSAGACFVTNDAPFAFNGSVSVRILNVVTGVSANQSNLIVSLPTGPKVSQWFCAQKPSEYGEARDDDDSDDDDSTAAASARNWRAQVISQLPQPPPPINGYTMMLVSSNGFPEHGHSVFNHEAAAITTEADCLSSCLVNHTTCKAVTWMPRPAEPCVHYQDVAGAVVKPSPGCHYYRLTHDNDAPYSLTPALPIDRNNFTKTLVGKDASVASCEAACNRIPKCLGFTKFNHAGPKGSWRNNCWLYEVVPSLVRNTEASWYQKPGTAPVPGPQPLPPAPPRPPPPPAPAPYPEPAQLNCTGWPQTTGWKQVGCNQIGGNCVLHIEVYNSIQSSGSPESWSTVPFQPPKHMQLEPAYVNWSLGQPAADGSHVPITLTSNATALYVVLTTAANGRFSDNSLLLESGAAGVRQVHFLPWDGPIDEEKMALLRSTLRVEHLAQNL